MKYSAKDINDLHKNIYEKDNQVVTHLVLETGKEIPSHASDMSVIVVIYQGNVDFIVGDKKYNIVPGDIIQMDAGENHSLLANKDSRLMVIKSDLK